MKQLLTLFFAFSSISSFGQQYCRMINSDTSIQYLKAVVGQPSVAVKTIKVTVEFYHAPHTTPADLPLTFVCAADGASIYSPTLIDPGITLPGTDFGDKPKTKEIFLNLSIKAVPVYARGNLSITMTIAKSPAVAASGSTTVTVTEKDESIAAGTHDNGDRPFWIELGTNLDLIDGPKPNNFTAGIFYHKFDHRWGKYGRTHWTSFAGAYEAKIISSVNNQGYRTEKFVDDSSFIPGNANSINTFTYAGKPKQTQTIRNWSFFFSPAYRLDPGESDDGNFHLYASLWAELRYQEVQTLTDNSSLLLIDTTLEPLSNLANYKHRDDTVVHSSAYTHYFGGGFPIYTETKGNKGFSFLLNPVFGISNQLTRTDYETLGESKNSEVPSRRWRPFYFVQFRLSDKEFGLTVTGEIRGLLIKNSPPQYTIALTKKFNLKKLIYYNGNE